MNVGSIASDMKLTHYELMEQQKEGFKQAKKAISDREGDTAINALKIAEESLDITRQQEAYVRFQAEKEAKERSNVRERSGSGSHSHKPSSKPSSKPGDEGYFAGADRINKHNAGGSHDYNSSAAEGAAGYSNKPTTEVSSSRHDYNSSAGGAGAGHANKHYSGNARPSPGDVERGCKPVGTESGNDKPRIQRGSSVQHKPDHVYDVAATPPTNRHLSQPEQQNQAHDEDNNLSTQQLSVDDHRAFPHHNRFPNSVQHDELHRRGLQDDHTTPAFVAAATGLDDDSSTDFGLAVGSLIQIPSPDPTNPLRYGTIKWIGAVPNVKGRIAGIELVIA